MRDVRNLVKKLSLFFGVQNMDREIRYMNDDDGDIVSYIQYEEDYQRITLKIYPVFFEKTRSTQAKCLLHEFCHTITIPVQEAAINLLNGKFHSERDIRERSEKSTSQIENILHDMFVYGMKDMKDSYSEYIGS